MPRKVPLSPKHTRAGSPRTETTGRAEHAAQQLQLLFRLLLTSCKDTQQNIFHTALNCKTLLKWKASVFSGLIQYLIHTEQPLFKVYTWTASLTWEASANSPAMFGKLQICYLDCYWMDGSSYLKASLLEHHYWCVVYAGTWPELKQIKSLIHSKNSISKWILKTVLTET